MSATLALKPAEEANQLHRKIVGSIDGAIRIGEILTVQKSKLNHGEWLPWIEANLEFHFNTAARYMKVYQRRDELKFTTEVNLTEAYRLLADTSEEAEP